MTPSVVLREVVEADLDLFFEQMRDAESCWMAAFTAKEPSDRGAFDAHWSRIRGDAGVTIRTIVVGGAVAGHVASFGPADGVEVTYWVGREYWGKGVATEALSQFLREVKRRSIRARAARDNAGSLRVLEKCGFIVEGHDRFFANARGAVIDEVILVLGEQQVA